MGGTRGERKALWSPCPDLSVLPIQRGRAGVSPPLVGGEQIQNPVFALPRLRC